MNYNDSITIFDRLEKLEEADEIARQLCSIELEIEKLISDKKEVPPELYEQRDIYDDRLRDALNRMRIRKGE